MEFGRGTTGVLVSFVVPIAIGGNLPGGSCLFRVVFTEIVVVNVGGGGKVSWVRVFVLLSRFWRGIVVVVEFVIAVLVTTSTRGGVDRKVTIYFCFYSVVSGVL